MLAVVFMPIDWLTLEHQGEQACLSPAFPAPAPLGSLSPSVRPSWWGTPTACCALRCHLMAACCSQAAATAPSRSDRWYCICMCACVSVWECECESVFYPSSSRTLNWQRFCIRIFSICYTSLVVLLQLCGSNCQTVGHGRFVNRFVCKRLTSPRVCAKLHVYGAEAAVNYPMETYTSLASCYTAAVLGL
jgi:hypothetical protein